MIAELVCVSPESAAAVAAEAAVPGDKIHTASSDGNRVTITYYDKRFPLDVAEWALHNGHAATCECCKNAPATHLLVADFPKIKRVTRLACEPCGHRDFRRSMNRPPTFVRLYTLTEVLDA